MEEKKKFTEKTMLGQVLDDPKAAGLMEKHGFHCACCPMAKMESEKLTIKEAAEMHGIDIKKLLDEMNEVE